MEFLRKHLSLVIRLLFSGGLLAFMASKMDWGKFFTVLATASWQWLALGFLLVGAMMVIGSERWLILLRVQGIGMGLSQILQLNLIGQFFNAFLLGVTGGDVIKIYYVALAVPDKRSAAGLSVVYDRIIGLLAIIVWGIGLSLPFYHFFSANPVTHHAVWTFYLISAAAFGGVGFALILPWIRQNAGLWRLEQQLPFHGTIERLSEAFERYAKAWRANLIVLGISLLIHLCVFILMYCVARSIHLELNFWILAAITSVVNVLIAIPISISGLGVREGLFSVFLGLVLIPSEKAVAFSLLGFAINTLWSLIGGLFYLQYKKPGESLQALKT